MYLHSIKTEYGHLRTLTENKELGCPAQTKCLAERIRFTAENGQATCSSESVGSTF